MSMPLFISCILLALGALGGWACIMMAGKMDEEARKANPDEDKQP